MITGVNYLLDEYISLSIIKSYILRYFAYVAFVMIFDFIVGWFSSVNFWMAFIYVGIVMLLTFLIDEFKIIRDISYINNYISDRKQG